MFNRIKDKISPVKMVKMCSKTGQSLVEVAIIAPLLIFLLLGVFEVGNGLRGYLVLVNMNREITRFAVRPGYLDFSTEETIQTSYQRVLDWANSSVSEQLDLNFAEDETGTSTLIISHLVVDTGRPCTEKQGSDWVADLECVSVSDCSVFLDADQPAFTKDDIIIHPGITGHEFQAQRFGPAETVTGVRNTRINYQEVAEQLARQNNEFNCEIIKKNGLPSSNNVIITELFQDEPQLFGFPFISNPYTDPFPLYTHTAMRLISAARSTGSVSGNLTDGIDTIGPVCFSFPTTVRRSIIEAAAIGQRIDILDGAGPSDFGWLTWNPHEDDEGYLHDEWLYPQLSVNDYTNPASAGWDDHSLNIGDYVTTLGGVVSSSDIRPTLESFAANNTILVIPVWDDLAPNGFDNFSNPDKQPGEPANVDAYKIWGFVEVRLDPSGDIGHTLSEDKNIYAFYMGEPNSCH
jgi:hypothetical protein